MRFAVVLLSIFLIALSLIEATPVRKLHNDKKSTWKLEQSDKKLEAKLDKEEGAELTFNIVAGVGPAQPLHPPPESSKHRHEVSLDERHRQTHKPHVFTLRKTLEKGRHLRRPFTTDSNDENIDGLQDVRNGEADMDDDSSLTQKKSGTNDFDDRINNDKERNKIDGGDLRANHRKNHRHVDINDDDDDDDDGSSDAEEFNDENGQSDSDSSDGDISSDEDSSDDKSNNDAEHARNNKIGANDESNDDAEQHNNELSADCRPNDGKSSDKSDDDANNAEEEDNEKNAVDGENVSEKIESTTKQNGKEMISDESNNTSGDFSNNSKHKKRGKPDKKLNKLNVGPDLKSENNDAKELEDGLADKSNGIITTSANLSEVGKRNNLRQVLIIGSQKRALRRQ